MNSKRTPGSLIPFGHQQVEGNDSGLSIAHMGMGQLTVAAWFSQPKNIRSR